MDKKSLEKHGCAVCALITRTGTHAGPVLMLRESLKEELNEDDFGELVIHMCTSGLATLLDGIFTLTEEGITQGRNFRASMELYKQAKQHGPISNGELN